MKKTKKAEISRTEPRQNFQVIPNLGKKLIWGGIGLLLIGFFVVTRADSHGQNWASHWTPLLLLAGYGLIACGLFYPPASGSDPSRL